MPSRRPTVLVAGQLQEIVAADHVAGTLHAATFALARNAAATVGTGKTNPLVVPFDCVIQKAFVRCGTGPTGAALIFDVNVNGTSIWSSAADRVRVLAAAVSGTQTVFTTTTLAEGDVLTVDIDQIGSTVAGQDITLILLLRVS